MAYQGSLGSLGSMEEMEPRETKDLQGHRETRALEETKDQQDHQGKWDLKGLRVNRVTKACRETGNSVLGKTSMRRKTVD